MIMSQKTDKYTPYGYLKEITEHAKQEVDWVKKYYAWVVGAISVIVAVGLYFSYNSVNSLKADLKDQGDGIQRALVKDIENLKATLQNEIKKDTLEVRQRLNKRIDEEFQQKNLQKLISEVATNRVQEIADKRIETEVKNKIEPVRESLKQAFSSDLEKFEKKVAVFDRKVSNTSKTEEELKETLKKAQLTLSELEFQSDILLTQISAISGDRTSYNKLLKFFKNGSKTLGSITKYDTSVAQTLYYIKEQYRNIKMTDKLIADINSSYCKGFTSNNNMKCNKPVLNMYNVWSIMSNTRAIIYEVPFLVVTIGTNSNLTIKDKLIFLYGVLINSKGDLKAAHYSGLLIDKYTDNKYKTLDFDRTKKWMEANIPNIKQDYEKLKINWEKYNRINSD